MTFPFFTFPSLSYLAYTVLLLLNVILAIPGAYYATAEGANTELSATSAILNIVFGIIFLLVDPFLALFCWFMPLYYAYR